MCPQQDDTATLNSENLLYKSYPDSKKMDLTISGVPSKKKEIKLMENF